MQKSRIHHWHVKKCAKKCYQCQKPFFNAQVVYSQLILSNSEWARIDVCDTCFENNDTAVSFWKMRYIPVLNNELSSKKLKKENLEEVLQTMLRQASLENIDTIFLLAIMLERKKIFVEKKVKINSQGKKVRVYESKNTNEVYLIEDPQLSLTKLYHIQKKLIHILDKILI